MASIGSLEWCEAERARRAGRTGGPGGDARVSFTATGGPDGEVSWHVRLVDGVLTELAPGVDSNADAAVTAVWKDAEAIAAGTLGANAAFMQGRLKATGATGPLLRWLAFESARPV